MPVRLLARRVHPRLGAMAHTVQVGWKGTDYQKWLIHYDHFNILLHPAGQGCHLSNAYSVTIVV